MFQWTGVDRTHTLISAPQLSPLHSKRQEDSPQSKDLPPLQSLQITWNQIGRGASAPYFKGGIQAGETTILHHPRLHLSARPN